MKTGTCTLAALLFFPTVVLAQEEGSLGNDGELSELNRENARDEAITTPDQRQLDPQLGGTSTDHLELDNKERPVNAVGPLIISPKFDFGAGLSPETDSSINPYEPVPEPAPGFVIKIPTN